MNVSRELSRGFRAGSFNGPLHSIREEETAVCLDCHVYFNVRNRTCPQCGGEQFWLIAHWKKQAPRSPRAAAPVRIAVA